MKKLNIPSLPQQQRDEDYMARNYELYKKFLTEMALSGDNTLLGS